jgi:SNF2 family DNA or RNA helicase
MDYVYILSGKPAPNGQLDYFSQMRIIDKSLLGSSFFQFRARFFHPTGYGGYTWVMNSGAEEAIADRIARRAIFIRKEDCLDLPDVTDIKRMIDLPDDIMKQYKVMEKQQLALLQDELIAVPNKMAAIMKLRQITSGFVLSNDEVVRFDSTKLHELMGVLEEIGDKQVIIWAQFKEEIRKIASAIADTGASVVTAYSETKDTDESIRMFKHGEAQYMVAHPATLKYGVTFTNCTYAVYYSMDYSFENYYQSAARIHRKGQTKPCTFIFLLAENTIDEIMYKVVNEKGDTAKVIEELARSAGRHK